MLTSENRGKEARRMLIDLEDLLYEREDAAVSER